jgi:deoxyribonuclease V
LSWPENPEDLVRVQLDLAATSSESWRVPSAPLRVAACFICFAQRGGKGRAGDPAWAAAVVTLNRRYQAGVVVAGRAGSEYRAGLMALREGPLLEAAVRTLPDAPEVLLVNATGRDHPRRAGLALHLGAILGLPSIGVTHRTLVAGGDEPGAERGMTEPLTLDGDIVGCWLRTRPGTRPVAVHAGWRTDPEAAVNVVMRACKRARTPEPMRRARRLARLARAGEIEIDRTIR